MRVEHALDSTRGPALLYPAGMRTSTLVIPLLFILADGVACKDDAPKGAEFGEPCGGDEGTPCADGLECYIGYCEEKCDDDIDCQPIEGFRHECDAKVCHIYCDEAPYMCPQTLDTPLRCITAWCESAL